MEIGLAELANLHSFFEYNGGCSAYKSRRQLQTVPVDCPRSVFIREIAEKQFNRQQNDRQVAPG